MSPRRENTLQIMCTNTIRSRGMAILCGKVPPLLESARTHARTHARVSPFTLDSRRVVLATLASRWDQVIHHASSPSLQSLPIAAFSGCIRLQRVLASTSRVEIYPPRARLPNRLWIESLSRGRIESYVRLHHFLSHRDEFDLRHRHVSGRTSRDIYTYEVESFAGNMILLSKSV